MSNRESYFQNILNKLNGVATDMSHSSDTHGAGPTGMDQATPVHAVVDLQSANQKALADFLNQPIEPVREDVLGDRMVLHQGKLNEKTDWKDLEPGKRPTYDLYVLEENDVLRIGWEVFNSIKGVVTERAVAFLMLLAYNIRTADGYCCFDDIPVELEDIDNRFPFDTIDNTPLYQAATFSNFSILISDETELNRGRIAKAYCYLAGVYMRLFTKSAENFMKIESHIASRFVNFYSFSFPFVNFHPTIDVVKVIKSYFELNSTLKNTFYNFLYTGEKNVMGKDIKGFLYEIHVSFTGLHSFVLFCRVMDAMNVTNKRLADLIYSPKFHSELTSIADVFTKLKAPKGEYELDMWRFGRIFDHTFMSSLQTKNSKFFTAVCANVLKLLAKDDNKSILDIVQLANMDETEKFKAEAYARRLIQIHDKSTMSNNYAYISGLQSYKK